MMAVEVIANGTFGEPVELFPMDDYLPSNGHPMFDVGLDGRFVMLRIEEVTDIELIMVQNYFEWLRQRLGN